MTPSIKGPWQTNKKSLVAGLHKPNAHILLLAENGERKCGDPPNLSE